jgi:hypothetical protein
VAQGVVRWCAGLHQLASVLQVNRVGGGTAYGDIVTMLERQQNSRSSEQQQRGREMKIRAAGTGVVRWCTALHQLASALQVRCGCCW